MPSGAEIVAADAAALEFRFSFGCDFAAFGATSFGFREGVERLPTDLAAVDFRVDFPEALPAAFWADLGVGCTCTGTAAVGNLAFEPACGFDVTRVRRGVAVLGFGFDFVVALALAFVALADCFGLEGVFALLRDRVELRFVDFNLS